MIYYPKRTDIFKVFISEPGKSSFSAFLYVKAFRNGIPHLVRVSQDENLKEELEHDIVKDQLGEGQPANSYNFICTTHESDPFKALEIAKIEYPEYFI